MGIITTITIITSSGAPKPRGNGLFSYFVYGTRGDEDTGDPNINALGETSNCE